MPNASSHAPRRADAMPVAPSIDDLLCDATAREPFDGAVGVSGSRFERVRVEGRPCVVKYLDVGSDWLMRASGSLAPITLTLWRRGILGRLPDCLDTAMLGVALEGDRGCAVLMRDVGPWLVPLTDEPVPLETH